MKKFFTLIELITVIVVLGILAAIVIPNISSFKEEAKETAILSDARNIQIAVDMYGLDFNGATPTKEKATLGNPQIIELYGIQPDYLRDTPKDNGAKFWLDSNNTVWASMVDAPTNVNYSTGKLTWNTVDGAELYKIYKSDEVLTSSIAKSKNISYIKNVNKKVGQEQSVDLPNLTDGTYLVTAVDIFDFETAPTKAGTSYQGYKEGPDKDFVLGVSKIPTTPVNEKPTAVISMSPESNLNTTTAILWSYANSTDPDGHSISKAEWRLNDVVVDSMPDKLPEGLNKIELRVQDEKGLWSAWVTKEVTTVKATTFTTVTFTNAGAIGLNGPTQSQLNMAYVGTELEGKVTSQNGIQLWNVPATGKYRIESYGAEGGGPIPGKGAILKGEFTLTEGQQLKILVGQKGNNSSGNAPNVTGGGGGGGTYVTSSTDTPLIVSGGGGGGGTYGGHGGQDASLTLNGTSTYQNGAGINGQGGKSGLTNGDGSGGGGFYSNGLNSTHPSGSPRSTGGQGFANGGVGGLGSIYQSYFGGDGGFGGGGGGWSNSSARSGGGGGYSGGQGGTATGIESGGGGGSYNSGTNQSNTVGHTGHGKVIITLIP